MANGTDLMQKLLVTFQGEAEDHLRALIAVLVSLEKDPGEAEQKRLVETLFRRMHTLKGAAHAVNLLDVAELCQSLESLLADLKRGELTLDAPLLDRLHQEVNGLERWIFPGCSTPLPRETAPAPAPQHAPSQVAAPLELHEAEAPRASSRQQAAPPAARPAAHPAQSHAAEIGHHPETVRVPVKLLESLLLQAEELVSAKLMVSELVQEISEISAGSTVGAGERSRLGELVQGGLRQAGEVRSATLAQMLREQGEWDLQQANRLRALHAHGERSLWALGGMVDGLLDDMRKLQLLPFASLTDPLPRVIREIGRELGKEAELRVSGEELEIDRRILAGIKEPLLHLVRNMMDHGIEPPATRQRSGKSPKGCISISVRHRDGNRAEISIADDGAGIEVARVKGAAIALELIDQEQADKMPDSDALQLIFESGLSTSPIITSISGRGLGLAIVREALEKLGGHLTVSSQPGEGTQFRLTLPLSFARLRALLVECSGRPCLIPADNLLLTVRVPAGEIRCVENRETVCVEGKLISLARLSRILELPEPEEADFQQIVVLEAADKTIAFAVENVVGVQEVLAKPLGRQLSRVRNVAGATVLGNGSVVPILNINDLFRSALRATLRTSPAPRPARSRQVSVLVAEDSITSRTLLKNILESAGFRVRTAVDGFDALTLLRSEEFDLVVSDVEMPRMDGFQLTAAIRGDKRLAELPLILVTGLESREDRERGIEVGANAYILKSSFDQGGLIDVIRKLT